MAERQFDVVVIGLGAMGSQAVAHLAARGARVIGIERFGPLNDRGSSHGDSRLIRLGYFEDPAYVPLLHRAYRNWRELEARTREELLTITGVLQIGRPGCHIVDGTIAACKLHNLPYDLLDQAQAARRYPAFQLDAGEVAVLEPEGGFLRPEAAGLAALRVAGADGAVLHFNERVLGIEPGDGGIAVTTDQARYRASRLVVAAGSYIAGLVPQLDQVAVPIRVVVGWFQPRDGLQTALGRMPGFLRDEGEAGSFFGFPVIGRDGVKVGKHAHFREVIDPEAPNAPVNEADRALLTDFIARRVPAAAGSPVGFATCRYTMLPGDDFLIDRLPGEPNIIVASPCSGHGFKFASVVGEILADLAMTGETALPIGAFSFQALARRVGVP